jgi:hypothetical protein
MILFNIQKNGVNIWAYAKARVKVIARIKARVGAWVGAWVCARARTGARIRL